MVSNSLFNQPLMNKYIKKYDKHFKLTHSKKESLNKWIKKLETGELKAEVANYGLFSRIILEDLLGYDYEKNVKENEKETFGRGLSEFALRKNNRKFMVIELKGSGIDLDKPQNRQNYKGTPVDQAFDYAKHSKDEGDIDWIFVSNYKEFRLYNWHKRQQKYISFMVEDLMDPEIFKSFMLVFSKFSTVDHNLIDKLVSKTIFVERDLEAEFYKLYNETRLMLIAELEYLHPEVTREKSVHYAQLILNRYIFICFAEDLGLLPEEISVETIEKTVKDQRLRGSEIWHDLNGLFIDVDKGNETREEKIYGYNGGLFLEDIEFLKIRDIVEDQSIFKDAYQKWNFKEYSLLVEEKVSPYSDKINPIYKNFMTISSFNFSSELDVNILGHIFENSIGDIEELKADEKGRRKKDGIFYTPEYITDYICRNTIIPYLSKSGKATNVEKLVREYWGSEIKELDEKVRNIKIVDPACGSGAFLNKASDVLLEIHEKIHEIEYKDDPTLNPYFDDVKERRNILLNNIYGVDLNEESVEITKLALFLKISKKGLKLPNLDKNIKCGNSIISGLENSEELENYSDNIDELIQYKKLIKNAESQKKSKLIDEHDKLLLEINSKVNEKLKKQFNDLNLIKPFNWEIEFPEIFRSGGFDIIIGNPPYVRQERIKSIKPYLKNNYETYTGVADLYVYFFEKGFNILKKGGRLSFICSNKFINVRYGKNLREFILSKFNFKKYVDYTYSNIFEDATTYPSVFVFEKGNKEENKILVNNDFYLEQTRLKSDVWKFEHPKILDLRDKIQSTGLKLNAIKGLKINYGIKTGFNEAFVIDEEKKKELIKKDPKSAKIIKPLLRGKDIKKYKIDFKGLYLIWTYIGVSIDEYPAIKNHLEHYKDKLLKRSDKGDYWFNLRKCAYYPEFDKKKIIWAEISFKPAFILDIEGMFLLNTSYLMTLNNEDYDLKYLLGLLNSKLLHWQFKKITTSIMNDYLRYTKQYVEQLPIYAGTPEQQAPVIKKVDVLIQLTKNLQGEINNFHKWLNRTFKIEKLSKKLGKYYELEFEDFLMEIKKKKVNIKTRKTQELLESEFNQSIAIINPLLQQIKETDREIDDLVYDLYGLTSEERAIVEKSLK